MLTSMNDKTLSRRTVVAGLPFLLAGCSGGYRSITGEPHSVPFLSIGPDLMRQEVAYGAPYRTGTVVVNIRERRLYLVQPGGRALRYAVGVGRAEARNFHGSAVIGRKETWPSWTPTANMMRAMPRYRAQAELKIRSGRGPFISTVTARIPISACMELTNRILSARRRRAAASGSSTKT
jgi:lipoprotein-anchoring transpeptidase ErfK/SrfK